MFPESRFYVFVLQTTPNEALLSVNMTAMPLTVIKWRRSTVQSM